MTGRSRRVTRQRLQDFINIHNAIPRSRIRIRRFCCRLRERYAEQPWTLPTSAAEGWSFVHSWLNVNTSTAQRQHSRCVAFKNWGKEAPSSRRVSGRFLWSLSPLLQTVGKFPPHVLWFVRAGEPDGVELCARLASAVEESKQELTLHGRRCVWEYFGNTRHFRHQEGEFCYLNFRISSVWVPGFREGLVSLHFPNNFFYVAALARRITHTRVRARCPMELDQNTAVCLLSALQLYHGNDSFHQEASYYS